jgi:hypothetical protein
MTEPVVIEYKDDAGPRRPTTRALHAGGCAHGERWASVTNIPGVVAGLDLLYQYGARKWSGRI